MKQAAVMYLGTAVLQAALLAFLVAQHGFRFLEAVSALLVVAGCLGTASLLATGARFVRGAALGVSALLALTCGFFCARLFLQLSRRDSLEGLVPFYWWGLAGLCLLGLMHAYATWRLAASRR